MFMPVLVRALLADLGLTVIFVRVFVHPVVLVLSVFLYVFVFLIFCLIAFCS